MARAEVEVGGVGRAPPRAAAASRATSAASAIWPIERRNFAATSRDVLGAGERRPRRAALGEGRQRHLDEQHGAVAERERRAARGRASSTTRSRALVERAQQPRRARPGSRPSRPSTHSRRPSSAADSAASAITSRSRRGRARRRPPAGGRGRGDQRRGVGPAQHDRAGVLGAREQAATRPTASARPGSWAGDRRAAAAGSARRSSSRRGAEQERGEPVGDLHGAVGERRLRVAEQRSAPPRAQRAVGAEARSTSARPRRRRPRAARRRAAGSASLRVTSSCR